MPVEYNELGNNKAGSYVSWEAKRKWAKEITHFSYKALAASAEWSVIHYEKKSLLL